MGNGFEETVTSVSSNDPTPPARLRLSNISWISSNTAELRTDPVRSSEIEVLGVEQEKDAVWPTTSSMVTIRLSEPVSTMLPMGEYEELLTEAKTIHKPQPADVRRRSSFDIMHGTDFGQELIPDDSASILTDHQYGVNAITMNIQTDHAVQQTITENEAPSRSVCSFSGHTELSSGSENVDWGELDKEEECEARNETSEKSIAFLLARLEQENNALATDPRSGLKARMRIQARPPSIHVLKQLVEDPPTASSHDSLSLNLPPMTELEFWAALVKDYVQTAQRLPTLTANKIKGGVPPPLRGVVWVSMVGARDQDLEERFDSLLCETSPYEGIIGKDLGRSFPTVEMFRDPAGEGQQMLGRVLNCFSLYDKDIGYCQGLGFLVGPLLMQMGDKDAFCVLVRLMENYGLRSCFLPDLSGLHLRIYQFQRLLDQHMPKLAAHLTSIGLEAVYLSQWFLSFFAVTCPLPMLFRIYDVIFAEGASETIMRVALSLMRRNEKKLMASREFDDIMQLLLSRSLWDVYGCNADDLVQDFVGFTGVVTRESMENLEKSFKEGDETGGRFQFLPDVTTAASRFLGRLWSSPSVTKPECLNPSPAVNTHTRANSNVVRRTPSRQSISSTFNGTDITSEGTNSLSTLATDVSLTRDSSGYSASFISKSDPRMTTAQSVVSKEDKDLHSQIESLLTALSELQRDHATLNDQLQKEREDRSEDHCVFNDFVRLVKADGQASVRSVKRKSAPTHLKTTLNSPAASVEFNEVVNRVDQRLLAYKYLRRSSIEEAKHNLRDSLLRSKSRLQIETEKSLTLSRQVEELKQDVSAGKAQLNEARSRLRDNLREKQHLEKMLQELKAQDSRFRQSLISDVDSERMSSLRPDVTREHGYKSGRPVSRIGAGNSASTGLRELRLGRSESYTALNASSPTTASIPKRTTSLATQAILATTDHTPVTEEDVLLQLVNAKTAEALAKQECEEVKAEMDALKKLLGVLPNMTGLLPPPSKPTLAANISNIIHRPSTSDATSTMAGTAERTSGSGRASPASAAWGASASPRPSRLATGSSGDTLSPPGDTAGAFSGVWGWGKRSWSSSSASKPDMAAVQKT